MDKPKVVASVAVPENRIYIHGAKARMSNVKIRCEMNDDDSVKVTTTADVEYDPIYIAVIKLGD